MAKGKQKKSVSKKSSSSAKSARFDWTAWAYTANPSPTEDDSSKSWLLAYRILLGVGIVGLLILSQVTGINADEKFQDHYSERILDYYLSGGEDTAALYEDDQSSQRFNKFYGGFFELLSAGTNRLLGNEFGPAYYSVRHFLNALFAVLLLVVIARWTRQLAGLRAAVFALILFLASPRLLGHGVMNPKDIPFAAGYVMAAFYLYRCLLTMPRPSWRDGLGFVLGAALATSVRAGGILVFCYSGLFLGLDFLFRYGFKGIWQQPKYFGRYAAYWLGSTLVAFALATAFWPYGLQDPIAHTLEALEQFSSYPVKITILFGGENISSDAIPKTYPLVWIGLTVALSALLGFLGSLVLGRSIGKQVGFMPILILAFVAIFPLAYIMLKDSALYDGWRQLLFVYPTTLVLGGLFYDQLSQRLSNVNWGRWAVLGGLLLLSADALVFTLRNPGLAYVYFNPLAGGVGGAFGNYELDYWGLSTKQAIEKLEDEGILHPDMDTLALGTTFEYNIRRQLDPSYRSKVRLYYVRAAKRFGETWDYGIFPSRFLRGPHLRNGTWPNSKTVFTIDANGVPVTAIERDPDQLAMQAEAALKAGNAAQAKALFEQEIAKYPDNEQGWTGLASAALGAGDAQRALEAAEGALKVAPDNETGIYLRAYTKLQTGQVNEAMADFQYLLRVDPENATAFYWLGEIAMQRQELQAAFDYFRQAIEYNPRLKQAYLRIADLFDSQGDSEKAQAYRQAASQI